MSAKRAQRNLGIVLGLLAAVCAGVAAIPPTQSPPGEEPGQFKQTFFYPLPYSNQKKMEIFGKSDQSSVGRGQFVIRSFKINTFRLMTNDPSHVTDPLEMVMEAPECVVTLQDPNSSGSSAGHLKVHTGDDRFLIEGDGYLWLQANTNATLTISNNVLTTVNSDFIATGADLTAPPASSTNTGRLLHIRADKFFFDRSANLITYTGHVHAEDDQLDLTCEVVTLHRSLSGAINDLVADGNIVVVGKTSGGRTTGDHAVYSTADGGQLVTLTGNPHWQDGPSDATAEAFIFDRARNTYQARGDAHLTLPSKSISDASFLPGSQPVATTNPPGAASDLVTISADAITMQLPRTNSLFRSFTAETNVVILDPAQDSRSTCNEAEYSDATGILELNGHANSQWGQRIIRGESIAYDTNSKSLSVQSNAYLKLPISALGPVTNLGGAALKTGATNLFLEITAAAYDFREDALTFHGGVHVNGLETETLLGTLDCGTLTVATRGNTPQSFLAESNVMLHQVPTADAKGATVERNLTCDRLLVVMRAAGLVESISATGRVKATGTEKSADDASPLRSELNAETLAVTFLSHTNRVDVATAERNVILTRNDEIARGAKLIYTGTNDIFVLTGDPMVEKGPNFHLASDEAIVYDHGRGEFRATKPKFDIFVPHGLSVTNNLLFPGMSAKGK